MLEKFFKLKENNTTVKTEIMAGITTFMTMAYILAVNPSTMTAFNNMDGYNGDPMSASGVFIATALAACIGSLFMALFANYPFALAPGMGLNAYFAYTVVLKMGYSWQVALTAVFVEGIIFVILSLTNVREAIFNAIPASLKHAVSCGIGLFIALIGLKGAGLVVSDPSTLVAFPGFTEENINTLGIGAILALIGIIVTAILLAKKVKGAILFGILITWILGIICELTNIYQVNVDAGFFSLIPHFENGIRSCFENVAAIKDVAFQLDFSQILTKDFFIVVFAFLFVDLFDTLGTLIGVSSKANMLDKDGRLPRIKGALYADSFATIVGACLGTSTTTTYVESATGVSEGGRTGLTALTTAILFGIAVFFSPIFTAIPAFATAPALVIVGFYMMGSVTQIDFNDFTEAVPAFICIITMPFMYSISEGITFGVITYVIINVCAGKAKEKRISLLMYILAALFLLKLFAPIIPFLS